MALANSGQAPPPYAGRYRLEQVLGRGPSGVVYDAVDLQAGGAMVAVKRLHPHHHDEQALLALQRDALSAAALCHPALAAPTVSGTDEEGGFYLAGPLVPGEALRQRLQRGPLSAAEVRGVFSAVCAGLDAAHRAGIHHGDLHPGNILCPGPGAAVVTDFGMAQLGQGAGSLWVGAPGYIAPEVYRGESAPATARADVFSLGAVLYECLTGQRPFAGPSPAAVMFKVCVSPLPGLPAAVPLPGERTRLEALLAMACDKDPERRFDNPAALWHAMDAVLTGEEAAAPAPAPTSPVAAPRRRTSQEQAAWFENEGRGEGEGDGQEALAGAPRPARPWRVALAAGAGGLVVLAGVLLFAPGRSPPPPVPAVAPAPAPGPGLG